MIRSLIFAALLVSGCTQATTAALTADAATPAGQLFCAVQTVAGPMVVAAIDAQATAAAPAAAPVAILATGATSAYVQSVCAGAGPGGIPVSPPANPSAAPKMAVVAPPATTS